MKQYFTALISAACLFGGCSSSGKVDGLGDRQQAGASYNGASYNGASYNGAGYNGASYNGAGYNGTGFSGIGFTGAGFSNSLPPGQWGPDWGLDAWINGRDVDGDSLITQADRDASLLGLSYLIDCMCAAGDNLPWTGDNPYSTPPHQPETRYFSGSFNLGPNWCHGIGPVPVDEMQMVSACLLARVNERGEHNSVSLRGYDATLSLDQNEKLFMAFPEGQYWGNAWSQQTSITDGLAFYENKNANACYFAWGNGNAQLAVDLQRILGRNIPWDAHGGAVKTSRACLKDGILDGSQSMAYADAALTLPIGNTNDPPVGIAGGNNSSVNGYQDSITGSQYVTYRGNQWRQMTVFTGAWADLEPPNWKTLGYRCDSACAPMDGCACYGDYCNGSQEGNTTGNGPVLCEQPSDCNNCASVVMPLTPGCTGTTANCAPSTSCVRGRALASLNLGCWLDIGFTRPYDLISGVRVAGTANVHKAGTLIFSYSNGSPLPASILIRDNIRNTPIDGHGFIPTAGWNDYQRRFIYPVYPGRPTFSGPISGIDIAIAADPASPVFPQLDYAQLWVSPPFGMKPREMYWNANKQAIVPNQTVCTAVTVDPDTNFKQAGSIRFRPQLSGADPNQLTITLSHNKKAVPYAGSATDPIWSDWTNSFQSDDPQSGTWNVCVASSGSGGSLDRVDLELQQL